MKTKRRQSITLENHQIGKLNSLKHILVYQGATKFFKEFCLRIFCHENILFWLDAEYYKNLPGSDYMKRTAIKIFNKYISDTARLQINISSSTKAEIFKGVAAPNRTLFARAQAEVLRLMETDIYPKFLRSDEVSLTKLFVKIKRLSCFYSQYFFFEFPFTVDAQCVAMMKYIETCKMSSTNGHASGGDGDAQTGGIMYAAVSEIIKRKSGIGSSRSISKARVIGGWF